MKDKLIEAMFDTLLNESDRGGNDIIGNQDDNYCNIFHERIEPFVNDEKLEGDLLGAIRIAELAAFKKGIEVFSILYNIEIK